MNKLPSAFIYFKIRSQAREDLPKIIDRKIDEFAKKNNMDFTLFGYGGTICHPLKQVLPFINKYLSLKNRKYIIFDIVKGRATSNDKNCAKEFSEDGKMWLPIPKGICAIGKYAFKIGEISPINLEIDLDKYSIGIGPNKGRRASDYIQNQRSRACLVLGNIKFGKQNLKPIKPERYYVCELKAPYAVFIR